VCAGKLRSSMAAADTRRSDPLTTHEPHSRSYMCLICGYVYDEHQGAPETGVPPGTAWDALPLSWHCPDCGATREEFEPTEEGT
jgi:rubredoxin